MRLVGQPAGAGDLAERVPGGQHQVLGAADTLPDDIGVRGFAEADLEGAAEMAGTDPGDARQILDPDALIQMAIDMVAHAADLPGGEAALDNRSAGCGGGGGQQDALGGVGPIAADSMMSSRPCLRGGLSTRTEPG